MPWAQYFKKIWKYQLVQQDWKLYFKDRIQISQEPIDWNQQTKSNCVQDNPDTLNFPHNITDIKPNFNLVS